MSSFSSSTGFKTWALLTKEQQRLALAKIERGLGEFDAPGNVITKAELMDQWYTFYLHTDGSMTVQNRIKM